MGCGTALITDSPSVSIGQLSHFSPHCFADTASVSMVSTNKWKNQKAFLLKEEHERRGVERNGDCDEGSSKLADLEDVLA